MKNVVFADFFQFIFFGVLISIVSSSCLSTRHHARNIKTDYNQVEKVEYPYFQKHLNPIGVSVTAGMTAVGAYTGYQSNLIQVQKEGKRESLSVVNALIGGLVGFGVSSLVNIGFGHTKRWGVYNKQDQERWLNKHGRKYEAIRDYNETPFTVIRITNQIERNFIFKHFKDLFNFQTAFPNSSFLGDKLERDFPNLSRSDQFKAFSIYYSNLDNTSQQLFREELLASSDRLVELQELLNLADQLYLTSYSIEINKKAKERIKGLSAYNLFSQLSSLNYNYPDSDWIPMAIRKCEQEGYSTSNLAELFHKHSYSILTKQTNTFYVYLPPRQLGITTINQINASDLSIQISEDGESFNNPCAQLVHEEYDLGLATAHFNATAIQLNINLEIDELLSSNEGSIYKYEIFNNSSRRAEFCFHTINMPDFLDGLKNARSRAEALRELRSFFGFSNPSQKTLVEKFVDFIKLTSRNDEYVRSVLIEYMCGGCGPEEKAALGQILRHAHIIL